MKKLDKSSVMKRAWETFKKGLFVTFAEALRTAWKNAKLIAQAMMNVTEECHTWYNWTLLGKEVIHESTALFKVEVIDPTTKKGTRILSYFGASQVCDLGTQPAKVLA